MKKIGILFISIAILFSSCALHSGTPSPGVVSRDADQDGLSTVELTGVPYIHQSYDSEDSFPGGNYCCSSATALMVIQYYRKLPPKPVKCTRGGKHKSDYGFYISNAYDFNGQSFDISSRYEGWGDFLKGYHGAFGSFLQDADGDSLQRSKRLSEYIARHGIESSVDVDAAGEEGFRKIRDEIDAGHPMVLLTDIVGGHYITCIGYVKGQHTLIFNDPYGNAGVYNANPETPNPHGKRVFYDWEGYDHGNPNLCHVERIIYARADFSWE